MKMIAKLCQIEFPLRPYMTRRHAHLPVRICSIGRRYWQYKEWKCHLCVRTKNLPDLNLNMPKVSKVLFYFWLRLLAKWAWVSENIFLIWHILLIVSQWFIAAEQITAPCQAHSFGQNPFQKLCNYIFKEIHHSYWTLGYSDGGRGVTSEMSAAQRKCRAK